jgi:chitinase
MTMNMPDDGDWAATMIAAGDSTDRTLATLWPTLDAAERHRRIGLTLMIGRNDTGPVTGLEDATRVASAVRERGFGAVGMWSVARDNGGCPGAAAARDSCSGVEQGPYAFLRALRTASAP